MMKLADIIRAIDVTNVTGAPDVEISGIACDSRKVRPGWLFVAIQGHSQDGRDFIADAVQRGAVAVVSEQSGLKGNGVCRIQVRDSRLTLGTIAATFHGRPSKDLQVVGITGTNGKTTVSFLTRDILSAAGRRPGLIGTVRYEIEERVIPAGRTTPEATELQSMLSAMLQAGCKSAVMEVSSHALDQKRTVGIDFDAVVFTNLTLDHLDYHDSMEDYFEAKALLFRPPPAGGKKRVGIVNADDQWGRKLLLRKDVISNIITYGTGADAMVRAENIRPDRHGSDFLLQSPWGKAEVRISLLGRFNVSNALAAIATGGVLGIEPAQMARAVAACAAVPGRLEEVIVNGGFQVFVDYAHTDDALANVLQALRENKPRRLIAVFGCGGNRDKSKRPIMGAVASRLADFSILTSDNPRKEDPQEIIAQIRHGFGKNSNFEVVVDRADAIRRALEMAGKGDIVLVAGKGHENFQEHANITIPFDDRHVVRSIAKGKPLGNGHADISGR